MTLAELYADTPRFDSKERPLWDHHVHFAERERYETAVENEHKRLLALPDAVSKALNVITVRCPERGCLLGQVFRKPLGGGGERFFLVCWTKDAAHAGFLNWAFTDDYRTPTVFWTASCRHGVAKLDRAWLQDCVGALRGWKNGRETIEQFYDQMPADLRKGIRSGVFHPAPAAWRSNARSRRCAKVRTAN